MKASALIVVALVILCFAACKRGVQQSADHPLRSFYYWRTTLDCSETDDSLAQQLGVRHFYLRLFDIDWNYGWEQPKPKGMLESSSVGYSRRSSFFVPLDSFSYITPCVYITNRTFLNGRDDKLKLLALQTATQIESYINSLKDAYLYRVTASMRDSLYYAFPNDMNDSARAKAFENMERPFRRAAEQLCHEIQIDCDWTQQSQKRYFSFLEILKQCLHGVKISCTVRLWQYRDKDKAGIPPVDRAMLMCYNVSNPKYEDKGNAIASASVVQQYLKGGSYPLPIDIALPIYSWAAMYKYGEFCELNGGMDEDMIANNTLTFASIGLHRYRFLRDTLLANTYYRAGDELRIDQVSPNELRAIAAVVRQNISINSSTRVAFFSWDKLYLNRYGTQFLDSLYNTLLQ